MKELPKFTTIVVTNYQKTLLVATKGLRKTKSVTVNGYQQDNATFIYRLYIEGGGIRIATDKGVYALSEERWLDTIPHILPISVVKLYYPELLL
jgi:hypothetical protein